MKKTIKKVKEVEKVLEEKLEIGLAYPYPNGECKHQNQGEGKCFDCNQLIKQ